MPIAKSVFVRLRINQGILNGTSIDTACRRQATIKYGVGSNPKIGDNNNVVEDDQRQQILVSLVPPGEWVP